MGSPGAGSWEPDLAHEGAESALEGGESEDNAQQALQSMLGDLEQRHKQGMAEVVQACRQQLSALHVSYMRNKEITLAPRRVQKTYLHALVNLSHFSCLSEHDILICHACQSTMMENSCFFCLLQSLSKCHTRPCIL